MVAPCLDGGFKIVEYTWMYPIYQAFFMIIYFCVSFACARPIWELWRATKKYTLPTNRYQVLFSLTLGAFFRAFAFLGSGCEIQALLAFLKDVFWLAAFVLIVLFWVELQTQVQRMQGIEKLKPYLIGILSFYTGVRLLAALSQLFFPKFKNALNALTILVYVSIMVIGQYYGQQLLAKMKQMSDKEFKKQLMKLTLFIILENITMVILLIVFLVRTYGFQTAKFREPWKWFWLKLLEKVMELLSIIVLSLTMLGDSGKKKSSAPAAATATAGASVRRAKKKPGSTSVDVANPVLVATQAQQGVVIEMPEAGMEGSKKHLLQ